MTKILKFPDLNSPASKKEFEKLITYKNAMEKKESVKVILPKKELVVEEIRRSCLSAY